MKTLFLIVSFVLIIQSTSFSQIRRDAVWCFGDSILIDFNHNPPVLDYCATRSRGTACSIADNTGDLLFYTHTFYLPFYQAGFLPEGVIWNKNHQVMENGDSIYSRGWYQEMVIIPDPGNSTRYYLFHTGVTVFTKLCYSVIDLSFNGGLGKVIQKNILVDSLLGRGLTDGLTAIKHGNGRDWWVMFRPVYSDGTSDNLVSRILITPTGIQEMEVQNIGLPTNAGFLRLYFNHSGNKMALTSVTGLIEYYDFDRCTGLLSNTITVHPENTNVSTAYLTYFWSAEFSPNDEVLYVSTISTPVSFLYQFRLTASNIASTKLSIDSLVAPIQGGDLKLALDGKIYWSGIYDTGPFPFPYADTTYNQYNMNLSVINEPNRLGQACDFQKYSFYLGGHRSYLGLPNNPNYDMIAKGGSLCDTLGLPNGIGDLDSKNQIQVYPNPASETIQVLFSETTGKRVSVRLVNVLGRIVLQEEMITSQVNISVVPEGFYLLQLFIDDDFYSQVKLTILK